MKNTRLLWLCMAVLCLVTCDAPGGGPLCPLTGQPLGLAALDPVQRAELPPEGCAALPLEVSMRQLPRHLCQSMSRWASECCRVGTAGHRGEHSGPRQGCQSTDGHRQHPVAIEIDI